MSNVSNSSSSSSRSSNKRRLIKIDDEIEFLSKEANNLNEYKTEYECSLMTLKMKREKVQALSAFARSQILLTEMEILIAEGDLFTDIERLRNFKRLKLESEEGQSQKDASQERNSKSTTKSMAVKKKRRHSCSKTSVVDTSDETVIIPVIEESAALLGETSQTSKTRFQSPDLFGMLPTHKSDSDVSLSYSIKAEFNEPYTTTQTQEQIKKSPAKKSKSGKKVKSQNKSKPAVKRTGSPTDRPKTVADLRKSVYTAPSIQTARNSSRTSDNHAVVSSAYDSVKHNTPPVLNQYFIDMQNNK